MKMEGDDKTTADTHIHTHNGTKNISITCLDPTTNMKYCFTHRFVP